MSKLLKVILITAGVLFVGIAALLIYLKTALPNVGQAPDLKVEITPERIDRGKYIAHSVAVCMDCHSTRDWTKFSGPLVAGTLGKGGEVFDQKIGFPGKYVSKNITPYGIGDWTDGEVFRAITSGVNKEGKALFPIMPHPNYGKVDIEDIYSIIAYIRTLMPIENTPEESMSDFPMNFIINTIPQKPDFHEIPDKSETVKYGEYLVTLASCSDCHTMQNKGKKIKGMEFAGGFEFPIPSGGIVRSQNLTPDIETGIGSWTEEAFVKRFKIYTDSTYRSPVIHKGEFNSMMPWTMYATMHEEDIRAIYAFLQTLKPIKHKVIKFTTP